MNKKINPIIIVNMIITNQFTHKVKNKSRHERAPSSICEVSDDSNKSNTDHQRNINGHMTEFALGVIVSTNCFTSSLVNSHVRVAWTISDLSKSTSNFTCFDSINQFKCFWRLLESLAIIWDGIDQTTAVAIVEKSSAIQTINRLICTKTHAISTFFTVSIAFFKGLESDFTTKKIFFTIENNKRNHKIKLAKFFTIFHKFHKAWSIFKKVPYTNSLVINFHANDANKIHHHDSIDTNIRKIFVKFLRIVSSTSGESAKVLHTKNQTTTNTNTKIFMFFFVNIRSIKFFNFVIR